MPEEHEPTQPATPPPAAPLHERVVGALRTIYDPEIPVSIYELGLIYDLRVQDGQVEIVMTLTSPSCPAAQSLPGEVEQKLRALQGVHDVRLELTWEPPWTPERMTPEARLQLGLV